MNSSDCASSASRPHAGLDIDDIVGRRKVAMARTVVDRG
jgi:hypothetical protein